MIGSQTNYRAMGADVDRIEDQRTAILDSSSFVDEANNLVPYSEQKRGYGKGDLRLGTSLQLGENIYSLAFVAML